MTTTARNMTHEMVNERLPWYVNGTLPEMERAAVAAHVEECAACRDDLRTCEQMARAARADSPVPIPPVASADAVLRRADSRARWRRVPDWRIAAAVAVVSVAGALTYVQVISSDDATNQRFTTTTEATSLATVDYVFQLRFQPSADVVARARVLEELGGSAQLVDATSHEYRLTMALPPQSLRDLDQRAANIAAREEVAEADVVALQVPVR